MFQPAPLRLIALATLLATSLVAQQPERDRGFGMVRNKAGKPWVGATVHLVHIVHSGIFDQDYVDRIGCVTDERGRFSARLLVGARYTAWATQPDGKSLYRVSSIVNGAVARTPILLDESIRPYRRQVKLTNHPSFNDTGPLTWVAHARLGTRHVYHRLSPDTRDLAGLPSWPVERIVVTAWSRGWPVFSRSVYTTPDRFRRYELRRNAGSKLTKEQIHQRLLDPAELRLPKRQAESILALDASTGRPIQGGRVARESTTPVFGIAPLSDAQGNISIVYASDDAGKRPSLRATLLADGYAETSLRFSSRDKLAPARATVGTTVKGKVTIGGKPLDNLPILLDASIKTGRGSTWFGIRSRLFRTDGSGQLAVPGRIQGYPYRLTAVLSPPIRARLRGTNQQAPPIASMAILATERAGAPRQLGPLPLDRMRRLKIQVKNKDGTPPGSVRVVLLPIVRQQAMVPSLNRPHTPLITFTNRVGRVQVIVGDCDEVLVYTATKSGAGWSVAEGDQKSANLTLDPRHLVTFRVVGSDGKPLANHSVSYVVPVSGNSNTPAHVVKAIRALSMNQSLRFKYGKTDQDGRVSIIMPLLGTEFDLSVTGPNRSHGRVVVPVPADHAGKAIEIEPVMKKR